MMLIAVTATEIPESILGDI